MVVQPFVGKYSDRTWIPKLGRRMPYLLFGAVLLAITMVLLPNASSFNFSVGAALIFGTICVVFQDATSNMAMQPFKMVVGDIVNEKQKTYAYSVQSFLVNASSVIAYLFPFLFAIIGIKNTAPSGTVPDVVKISYYVGVGILVLCVIQSLSTVKEMPPEEYYQYHPKPKVINDSSFVTLIKRAPKTFWTVGLVQFFCWGAFLLLWTYSPGTLAHNIWHTTDTASNDYNNAANWYGIASAVMALAAVVWALFIPKFKNHRYAYVTSLVIGAIGFFSVFFVTNKFIVLVSYAFIGCAWSVMMALPFTILTNSLKEGHVGAYLGLFNCSICIPQIVIAVVAGFLMPVFHSFQPNMFIFAAILMVAGVFSVFLIKENAADYKIS
jgi:maltose/moltooligosaccharide transporter